MTVRLADGNETIAGRATRPLRRISDVRLVTRRFGPSKPVSSAVSGERSRVNDAVAVVKTRVGRGCVVGSRGAAASGGRAKVIYVRMVARPPGLESVAPSRVNATRPVGVRVVCAGRVCGRGAVLGCAGMPMRRDVRMIGVDPMAAVVESVITGGIAVSGGD